MKKNGLAVALVASLFITALVGTYAWASDITGAHYKTSVAIGNNGTAESDVFTTFSLNTTDMIGGGMANATAEDLSLVGGGVDIAVQPGIGSNPWCTYVSSIGASGTVLQYLYHGGVTGGKICYFPGAAGMSINDSASSELGGNFNVAQAGHVDTTYTSPTSGNHTIRPSANGTQTDIGYQTGTGDHWELVDDEVADDATTEVHVKVVAGGSDQDRDLYALEDPADEAGVIAGVTVYVRCKVDASDAGRSGWNKEAIKTHGTAYDAPQNTMTQGAYNDFSYEWATNPYTGSEWTWQEIQALEVGVHLQTYTASGGNWSRCTQVYAVVEYDDAGMKKLARKGDAFQLYVSGSGNITASVNQADNVTASGVTTGAHSVNVTANTTHLHIYIDDVLEDTTTLSANVTDTVDGWTLCESAAMPYMEYHRIYVGGVIKQSIAWDYDTTFTDRSGNGNDATPTFRTASSDADVWGYIVAQEGIIADSTPAANESGGWIMIDSTPATPDNLFSEGGDNYSIGGFDVGAQITTIATDGGYAPETWHFLFAYGLSALAMAAMYKISRGGSDGDGTGMKGSLLLATIAGGVVMGIFYRFSTIPGWTLFPYGLLTLFIILWRKSPDPVG